jgi:hypothetical protein
LKERKPSDDRTLTAFSNLPEPEQFWPIQADEPRNTMALKSRVEEWFRPLEPTRRKRDIGAAVGNGDRM